MEGKILLCVTGGITYYKAIDLASQLTKSGFEVKTAMTKNALKFVSALNFSAITNQVFILTCLKITAPFLIYIWLIGQI